MRHAATQRGARAAARRRSGTSSTGGVPDRLLLPHRVGRSRATSVSARSGSMPPPSAPASRSACVQHALELGLERDDLELARRAVDLLHDRAARVRRGRGAPARPGPGVRGACSARLSTIERMSRMCTPSSSRFCSTFCSAGERQHLGHDVLDQLGRQLGRRARPAAALSTRPSSLRRMQSASSATGGSRRRCRHQRPCSRPSAPASRWRSSIQMRRQAERRVGGRRAEQRASSRRPG